MKINFNPNIYNFNPVRKNKNSYYRSYLTHPNDTFEKNITNITFKGKDEHPFKPITYEQAHELLTDDNIKKVQQYLLKNCQKMDDYTPAGKNPVLKNFIEIEGKRFDAKYNGGGGTKNTFLIEHQGKKYIAALCSYTASVSLTKKMWDNMLKYEPNNTKLLRENGFKTNDISDIVPVKIEGAAFPAIIMKPYSEHKFEVADAKNYSFVNLFDANTINRDRALKILSTPAKDIAKAVKFGIKPSIDIVNLCKDKKTGEFHIYFNDLGEDIFCDKTKENPDKLIELYVYLIINALNMGVEPTMAQWSDYLSIIQADTRLKDGLIEIAQKKYKK